MIDVIGGRAGDGLDRFLDNTDAFAAGVSSTVTGGLSDKVRAGIYGDITDQSDNGWYTAGQVVGIAPAFATGLATGGTGALAIASKAFATLDTAHGFYESGSKFANGEPLHWTDYASFLPLGGAASSRFKDAIASRGSIFPTGVAANRDDLVIDAYGFLRLRSDITGQAHHLNQDAAFRDRIGKAQGISVKLDGNAFTDLGTPHYNAHESLEAFWDIYRRGGIDAGNRPSINLYNRALYNGLQESGLSPADALRAVQAAKAQQLQAGLRGSDLVPRLPNRINQVPRAE